MLWTIRLEFTPDGGEPQVRQIATISRSMIDLRPEEAGLTLQEGRELLRGIECQIIANQVRFYTLCFGSCPDCGQRRQFKDVRTKCVRTVLGAYRFRGRGICTCACEAEQGIRHPSSRWECSFHAGRLQKFAFCSPDWVRECLIGRPLACWKSAASAE